MFFLSVLLVLSLLCGCTSVADDMQPVTDFRQKLLVASNCSFDAFITADYSNTIYQFKMHCQMDSDGKVRFTVTEPDTIAGISGSIRAAEGSLTFDETALAFPILANDRATPVSAPWIFLNSLRSGYLKTVGREGDGYRIGIDDSYEENALHLEILTDALFNPSLCEIYWDGQRILSLEIENFQIL